MAELIPMTFIETEKLKIVPFIVNLVVGRETLLFRSHIVLCGQNLSYYQS
jgi:hypothetical protein